MLIITLINPKISAKIEQLRAKSPKISRRLTLIQRQCPYIRHLSKINPGNNIKNPKYILSKFGDK